jgi:hypothetical protein
MQDHQFRRQAGAHGVADDVRLGDLQVIEQADDVFHHLKAVFRGIARFAAAAMPAEVEGQHPVVRRQGLEDAAVGPFFGAATEAVDEHDGVPLASVQVADADSPGFEALLSRGQRR